MLKKNIKMYKKSLLLLVFVFFAFLTSCRTSRQEIQKSIVTTESIIEQKETYRDTTLFTPKSETSLKIPVTELVFKKGLNNVSKPKTFTQKNGNATAKIEIVPDGIKVTATCDSLAIVAKIKKELYREINTIAQSNIENNKSKTGYTFFDVFLWSLFAFILGFFICYIFKFFKII
jgi:hypothetical protein